MFDALPLNNYQVIFLNQTQCAHIHAYTHMHTHTNDPEMARRQATCCPTSRWGGYYKMGAAASVMVNESTLVRVCAIVRERANNYSPLGK